MIRRWQAGGLLVRALPPLLLVAACTSVSGTSSPTTDVAISPEPTSPPTTTITTTIPAIDGAEVLMDAIAATGSHYRYVSTVEVSDLVLATIEGVVAGTGFTALIDAGDAPVEYRKTDGGEWLRQGDGDWSPLAGEPAPASEPLAVLAAPVSVSIVSNTDSSAILDAVFAGASLGTSADEVTVRITIADRLVREIDYAAALGDSSVRIVTTIDDVGAVEPIPSP